MGNIKNGISLQKLKRMLNKNSKFFKSEENAALLENDGNRLLHKNMDFVASEQYRMLRTNIMFTLPSDVKCPVIGVTSSTRGEGKSTTSVNLAYVIAENDLKVLLIDADLRIPSIENKIGERSEFGLTDLLIDNKRDIEKLKSSINDNLYIMTAGDIPPNPAELLGSQRMERTINSLKEHFDCIIIDLPPVNLVTDAASISPYLTGMVVVVRENYVAKRDLDNCFRQLNLAGTKILGFVMNDVDISKGSYGKYGYYKKETKTK